MTSKKHSHLLLQKTMLIIVLVLFSKALIADPANNPINESCPSSELDKAENKTNISGKEVYQNTCALCHSADGTGRTGVFPPLKGSEWTQNEFVIANIVLRGVSGTIVVSGEKYASSMGSFANQLSDQEIVALITYIQQEFNGTNTTITEKDIADIRAKNLRRISSQSGLIALQNQYK